MRAGQRRDVRSVEQGPRDAYRSSCLPSTVTPRPGGTAGAQPGCQHQGVENADCPAAEVRATWLRPPPAATRTHRQPSVRPSAGVAGHPAGWRLARLVTPSGERSSISMAPAGKGVHTRPWSPAVSRTRHMAAHHLGRHPIRGRALQPLPGAPYRSPSAAWRPATKRRLDDARETCRTGPCRSVLASVSTRAPPIRR